MSSTGVCPRPCARANHTLSSIISQGKNKHININKSAGLSRDWVGGKKYDFVFRGVIPYGGEKTHKQNPPKSRDNPVKSLYVFLFGGFFAPKSDIRAAMSCS